MATRKRKLNDYKPQVAQDNTFLQRYIYDHRLSVIDLKIFKALLTKIKYNESLFSENYILEYETLEIAGVPKRNRYKEVEKSLINLMNTFVTIREKDRERFEESIPIKVKGDRKLGLIKNDWIHDKHSSKIIVSIPEILKPFFLELADKEYTIYALENLKELNKIYEIKLYEFFAKWKNRGYVNFTVENLRDYLEIEDGKYASYANFKNHILLKAIKKISDTTNLNIQFRELKKNGDILTTNRGPGNKVFSIEFFITDKEKFDPDKFIGKFFTNSDGVEYLILEIKKDSEEKYLLKLFDKKTSEIANLSRPISIEELTSGLNQ